MKTTGSGRLQFWERIVSGVENPPWFALHRIATGYVALGAFHCLGGEQRPRWVLWVFFLAVLAALRLVPGALRRLFPFSDELRSSWATWRGTARRYDSFQWQKLFWLGLGMAGYLARHGAVRADEVALASFCVVSGAFGLAVWAQRRRELPRESLGIPIAGGGDGQPAGAK